MFKKIFGSGKPATFVRVKIGTINNTSDLRTRLRAVNCEVSSVANEMLDEVAFCDTEQELDLVIFSARNFFDHYPSISEVIGEARMHSLFPCPSETAPQICLQYIDLPIRGAYMAGMKPLRAGANDQFIFNIYTDDQNHKLHLGFRNVVNFHPDLKFIFSRNEFVR